jgi:hypothetical protein
MPCYSGPLADLCGRCSGRRLRSMCLGSRDAVRIANVELMADKLESVMITLRSKESGADLEGRRDELISALR